MRAAKAPVASLQVEEPALRVTTQLALRETQVVLPWSTTGVFAQRARSTFLLSGLGLSLSLQDGVNDFGLGHVGFGEAKSYLEINEEKIFTGAPNSTPWRHRLGFSASNY